ncbi:MAG: pyroglutamyl-peptidase I [Ruminococcaceae bacterium]|nr:pyroglutamyl-peptidase I [Oscillospiraceae bacterium]
MKKLLITGFDPFGGESINPSWEAVKLIPDIIGDYEVHKMEIPTVFNKAFEVLMEKAEEIKPDVIISVGQAGGRRGITPERVGINLMDASIPDNEGNKINDKAIIENGENAYFTTLNVKKMMEAIKEIGLPASVSLSAGAFVCNNVLYLLLDKYKNTEVKAGFIHVPFIPSQLENKKNKEILPSMELMDIAKGLEAAIEVL